MRFAQGRSGQRTLASVVSNARRQRDCIKKRTGLRLILGDWWLFAVIALVVVATVLPSTDGNAMMQVCGTGSTSARGVTAPAAMCWFVNDGGPANDNGGRQNSNVNKGGGGSEFEQNRGAKEQETDDKQSNPCGETAGNPVVLATGNKVEPEVDFTVYGEFGLYLARTYNSQWSATGLFGNNWLSNFDYSLAFSTDRSIAWLQRPDGRRLKLLFNATSSRWNEDKAQPVAYLIKNADGSYFFQNEDHGSEAYDADGYITELRSEQGIYWAFSYSGKFLQQVTHSSGRSIRFTWTNGQVTQVTDPAGNIYQYTYTPNVFGAGRGRLASATLPGTPVTTISYHYEDARFLSALTGKSINGTRHSWFTYDSDMRAISSEHANGVEHYSFSYQIQSSEQVTPPPAPPPPGGYTDGDGSHPWCDQQSGGPRICYEPYSMPVQVSMTAGGTAAAAVTTTSTKTRAVNLRVTETSPLGRQTTHGYSDGKKVSVTGAASPNCPASYREFTYDANGYEDIVTDFAGNLTDFDYDAHGHLLKRVDAAGHPEERTTTYAWDEAKNRITRVSVLNDSEVTYTYTDDGRVASVATKNLSGSGVPGQTRTITYAYTKHPNGLVASLSVDGPLSADTVSSTFSAQGDLLSTSDSSGTTTYSNYNALGLPGRITGKNGEVTNLSYDARGRVTSQDIVIGGSTRTTRYTYDTMGNVVSMQLPDGVALYRQYDDAGRLVREYQPESAGTFAVKRYTYNNASLVASVVTERTTAVAVPAVVPSIAITGNGANGNYTVTWGSVAGAESYSLQEKVGGGAWTSTNQGAATSKQYSGKSAGDYSYRVQACNAEGCGSLSEEKSVQSVYAPTVAPAISASASQVINGSYTISWSAVATASAYTLQESANGGAWINVPGVTGTNKSITGKSAGDYDYRVYGSNIAGAGPLSGTVRVRDIDPPVGAPSVSAPAINPGGSFTVSWTAVPTATSYQLYESANGGASWSSAATTPNLQAALSGRNSSVDLYYRVRACNDAGCAGYSSSVLVQRIINDAQFVSYTAPTFMYSGNTANISITMKNTGNVPWTVGSGRQFYFGRTSTVYPMPDRIAVASQVNPGGSATFVFSFKGPTVTTPVSYQFGGRMISDGAGWFGAIVPTFQVTVEKITGTCRPGDPACTDPYSIPVDPVQVPVMKEEMQR